jgi:predicted SAM-dependent methyltransferase
MDKVQFTEEQADYFIADIILPAFTIEEMTTVLKDKFKNFMRNKGYIISVKSEEPLIVHNVMSYKDKNYLKQYIQINPNCNKCELKSDNNNPFNICRGKFKCDSFSYWKLFDNIQITDGLACMRKEIGDIYITRINSFGAVFPLYYVLKNNTIDYTQEGYMEIPIDKFRLSTAEELQEYFKENKYL